MGDVLKAPLDYDQTIPPEAIDHGEGAGFCGLLVAFLAGAGVTVIGIFLALEFML